MELDSVSLLVKRNEDNNLCIKSITRDSPTVFGHNKAYECRDTSDFTNVVEFYYSCSANILSATKLTGRTISREGVVENEELGREFGIYPIIDYLLSTFEVPFTINALILIHDKSDMKLQKAQVFVDLTTSNNNHVIHQLDPSQQVTDVIVRMLNRDRSLFTQVAGLDLFDAAVKAIDFYMEEKESFYF